MSRKLPMTVETLTDRVATAWRSHRSSAQMMRRQARQAMIEADDIETDPARVERALRKRLESNVETAEASKQADMELMSTLGKQIAVHGEAITALLVSRWYDYIPLIGTGKSRENEANRLTREVNHWEQDRSRLKDRIANTEKRVAYAHKALASFVDNPTGRVARAVDEGREQIERRQDIAEDLNTRAAQHEGRADRLQAIHGGLKDVPRAALRMRVALDSSTDLESLGEKEFRAACSLIEEALPLLRNPEKTGARYAALMQKRWPYPVHTAAPAGSPRRSSWHRAGRREERRDDTTNTTTYDDGADGAMLYWLMQDSPPATHQHVGHHTGVGSFFFNSARSDDDAPSRRSDWDDSPRRDSARHGWDHDGGRCATRNDDTGSRPSNQDTDTSSRVSYTPDTTSSSDDSSSSCEP